MSNVIGISADPPGAGAAHYAGAGDLRWVAATAAAAGGSLFLVGTILHPARDGHGVAAAGDAYGLTHSLQAIGLMMLVVALAALMVVTWRRGSGPAPWLAALAGTVAWLGLIVYDGAHNPATAQRAPELVHAAEGLSAGGAVLVIPGLVLFPLGYAVLAVALARRGQFLVGSLTGAGAATYTAGGLLIFALGPTSAAIQIVEVAGAAPFALGMLLLGVDAVRRTGEAPAA